MSAPAAPAQIIPPAVHLTAAINSFATALTSTIALAAAPDFDAATALAAEQQVHRGISLLGSISTDVPGASARAAAIEEATAAAGLLNLAANWNPKMSPIAPIVIQRAHARAAAEHLGQALEAIVPSTPAS